jgi:xylulose-5-phosphate/fructose-6-phosphate phosphoketolase
VGAKLTVLNALDCFHLLFAQTGDKGIYLKQQFKDKLIGHKKYVDIRSPDMPEIRDWLWGKGDFH